MSRPTVASSNGPLASTSPRRIMFKCSELVAAPRIFHEPHKKPTGATRMGRPGSRRQSAPYPLERMRRLQSVRS
jgi:hypothetical protein